jgi:uncharacterized pyridoxal phosphate-containing UPF0001 family protein
MSISANYARTREEIPDYVTIVVSCKTRTTEEIKEVIDAGATDIGENYIQKAGQMYSELKKIEEGSNMVRIGTAIFGEG